MQERKPVSFLQLLFLLFLTLKLINKIDWSWGFIFSPFLLQWLINITVSKKEESEAKKENKFQRKMREMKEEQEKQRSI